jgi:hypothetical protein
MVELWQKFVGYTKTGFLRVLPECAQCDVISRASLLSVPYTFSHFQLALCVRTDMQAKAEKERSDAAAALAVVVQVGLNLGHAHIMLQLRSQRLSYSHAVLEITWFTNLGGLLVYRVSRQNYKP